MATHHHDGSRCPAVHRRHGRHSRSVSSGASECAAAARHGLDGWQHAGFMRPHMARTQPFTEPRSKGAQRSRDHWQRDEETEQLPVNATSHQQGDTMKALVKNQAQPGLWLEDVPIPSIGLDDVLIRVLRTGICGTDLHIYDWDAWAQRTVPTPLIIGHEFVGTVV